MSNRIRMYFAAFGDWSTPDPVSAVIGREPTSFKVKGERINQSSLLRKRSIWAIDSGLPEHAEVGEHLAALLTQLEAHVAGVRSLASSSDVGIQCAAYWHTSQPGFHLSRELLSRVAALGVSLDFDMYCIGDEEALEPVG
jgi:hypothetical protein